MMAIANDKPAPDWRNFAAWGAVGAIGYILAVCGGILLLQDDGIGAILRGLPRSKQLAATLGLGLIFAMAVAGFISRKRPISLRNVRNSVIRDVVAVGVLLVFVWGFSALARASALGAMGASEWVAAVTGSVLIFFALLGTLATASAHTRADLLDDEVAAEEMRERGRLFLYSFAWMAACGLLLIGLSLAGPGGVLPAAAALAGALVLIAVMSVLGIATWRLSDELVHTLSHETGNLAFYFIWVLGGGWAILARLGFVAAPAPLDWLTMFTVLLFAASFIAAGRRKLLSR
jgi:hypothetical protein